MWFWEEEVMLCNVFVTSFFNVRMSCIRQPRFWRCLVCPCTRAFAHRHTQGSWTDCTAAYWQTAGRPPPPEGRMVQIPQLIEKYRGETERRNWCQLHPITIRTTIPFPSSVLCSCWHTEKRIEPAKGQTLWIFTALTLHQMFNFFLHLHSDDRRAGMGCFQH